MKKLILALCFVFVTTSSFAAMSADIDWEFRSSATAAMVNGGGFKEGASGTDYSQQDSAEASDTDLVVANGDYDRIYSAAVDFNQGKWVGNVIHITDTGDSGNFTVGWYEITGVGDDGDDYLDIDRDCATGNDTGGDWYLGGAMNLNSSIDDEFFEQLVAGQTVWFKSGTHAYGTESISMAQAGSALLPIKILGYNSTRGDNPTGTDRPLLSNTTGGNSGLLFGAYVHLKNFRGASIGPQGLGVNGYGIIENCSAVNTRAGGGNGIQAGAGTLIIHCDATSDSGSSTGYGINASYSRIVGCYVYDCGLVGIYVSGDYGFVSNCLVVNNPTGILVAGVGSDWTVFYNNTIFGAETPAGTGINLNGSTSNKVFNNIIYGWVTGISNTSSDASAWIDYNLFYNNTANSSNVDLLGNNVTGSDPLFNDTASGDFTLKAGSPALGACVPVGDGSYDYEWNIGVDQDDNKTFGGHLVTF